jgi:hypothetical protein
MVRCRSLTPVAAALAVVCGPLPLAIGARQPRAHASLLCRHATPHHPTASCGNYDGYGIDNRPPPTVITLSVPRDARTIIFRQRCHSQTETPHTMRGRIRPDLSFRLSGPARPALGGTEVVAGRFVGPPNRFGHLSRVKGTVIRGCRVARMAWRARAV